MRAQRLVRHHLQHAAEHIGRVAVFPDRSGLGHQRQLGNALRKRFVGQGARHPQRLTVAPLQWRIAREAIGQPAV